LAARAGERRRSGEIGESENSSALAFVKGAVRASSAASNYVELIDRGRVDQHVIRRTWN
jgi:hypothetical protein